jgi:hypothetical protein
VTNDPDVAHIRGRLGDWDTMTPQERQRLASMLTTVASPTSRAE